MEFREILSVKQRGLEASKKGDQCYQRMVWRWRRSPASEAQARAVCMWVGGEYVCIGGGGRGGVAGAAWGLAGLAMFEKTYHRIGGVAVGCLRRRADAVGREDVCL